MDKNKEKGSVSVLIAVDSFILLFIGTIIVCPWLIAVSFIVFLWSLSSAVKNFFDRMDDTGWPTDWGGYV